MIKKIIKNDLMRNKTINFILFSFIFLASLLLSLASSTILMLSDGIDQLMTTCMAPHFVQMHTGEIVEEELQSFNKKYDYIESFQISEMLSIDGKQLYIGDNSESEVSSVMDISFVTQNDKFDFLLSLDNEIIRLQKGQIAVPIYYKSKYQLELGDTITLKTKKMTSQFKVTSFLRDSQMNPSLVSSKRFLISHTDYYSLEQYLEEKEYLIEYRFESLEYVKDFSEAYNSSPMPKTGPQIDYTLLKVLNSITDGIVILVLTLISLLLIFISVVCLRYILLSVLEEDMREIGVMKALGIPSSRIRLAYIGKHIFLAAAGSSAGYVLSIRFSHQLNSNISQTMGAVSYSGQNMIASSLSVLIIFFIVALSCWFILRRIPKISTVAALTQRFNSSKSRIGSFVRAPYFIAGSPNVFLGVNSIQKNLRSYSFVIMIFSICAFIMILPLHISSTIQSRDFVNYMGISQSDIRIDVRQSETTKDVVKTLEHELEIDKSVKDFAVYKTVRVKTVDSDGEMTSLPLEMGDINDFPLKYMKGHGPYKENEIVVSAMVEERLGKSLGDTVRILSEKDAMEYLVVGIYQDITNGGITAKTQSFEGDNPILWHVINVDLKSKDDKEQFINKYENLGLDIKITDLKTYIDQTFGATLKQIETIKSVTLVIALSMVVLITTLASKLMISKEYKDIGIMKSIGFSDSDIRKQYFVRMSVSYILGFGLGVFLLSTLGEKLVGIVGKTIGASQITLVINPWVTYFVYPCLLWIAVMVSVYLLFYQVKITEVRKMILE